MKRQRKRKTDMKNGHVKFGVVLAVWLVAQARAAMEALNWNLWMEGLRERNLASTLRGH